MTLTPRGRFAKPSGLHPAIKRIEWAPTGRTPSAPEMRSLSVPTRSEAPIADDLVHAEGRILAAMDEPPAHLRSSLPAHLQQRFTKKVEAFVPSEQQRAFFDEVSNGTGNILLIAAAGCGKTTTLIQALFRMEGNVFFGAYNKSAAADIKAKATKARADRRGIKISTVHGSGYYDFKSAFPRTEVDDNKVRNIIEGIKQLHPRREEIEQSATFIARMVSFGKQFLMGCKDKPDVRHMPAWLGICEHFSADADLVGDVQTPEAMEWVIEVFERSRVQCVKGLIDFDDMIYAPIAYGVRLFPNEWVLVDEAQDINPARRELAKRLIKRGGRAIFVGDPRQSIYGFTGAGGDSIDRIREEFKCKVMPLTVTYRCPKAVVRYAQQWVGADHIQAHETAPEGIVRPVIYAAEIVCPNCGHRDLPVDKELPDKGGSRHLGQLCQSCFGKRSIKPRCVECKGKKVTTFTQANAAGFMTAAPCGKCQGTGDAPIPSWFVQDPPAIDDVILCRYTRPLIQTAYAMIKQGIACRVEGRDIGLGLIALARMWKITTITRLEERLAAYLKRQLEKAAKAQSERQAQEVEDRVGTLRIFIERCRTLGKTLISELVAEITSMFADDVTGVVTLCSGHKSKGREWPRVYWIQTGDRRQSRKEWENEQETNVKYVIATRAMRELILVPETFI